ncbi:shikimate dehydrogenase family protein [Maribacter chungangensis]|uniref:Shikimate dehydrogenase family protein n=1 Tax=Maribacter chungangensis TaxID=1069117 RepID=A0ABW3B7E4_9FLAO
MEKTDEKQFRFGLLGKNISYSFSKGYFTKKFSELDLPNYSYENFDMAHISEFTEVIQKTAHLSGLNVTIPYKQEIIPYLNELAPSALEIGAVNTIKITPTGLKGFNTDAYGFQKSLEPYLKQHHNKALILGTGGASKAVAYVLDQLKIEYSFVSRTGKNNGYTYGNLDQNSIESHRLLINCSPLGTFPNITDKPKIPYAFIGQKHLLFDLIYNPEKTAFLAQGEIQGATILNGLRMLELQAEKAWEIWNT